MDGIVLNEAFFTINGDKEIKKITKLSHLPKKFTSLYAVTVHIVIGIFSLLSID